ncbi:MAG TPA: PDZ domain-containing protein [Candidatus Acidoferrales bacterium]|nr:PDZ domain-containing protein [Candidatus Acidoferrales bacterium]
MHATTYIKQGVFVVATLGVLVAVACAQSLQTPALISSPPQASASESLSQAVDQAQWQRDMRRLQADMEAQAREIQRNAMELKSEVAKEMVENGLTNRADMNRLTARLHAQQAGIEADAQAVAAQGQQLFAQTQGLLDASDDAGWLGIEIAEVTPEKAKEFKLPRPEGVIVSEVLPDGPSAKAGLQAKDVILEYDGQPVEGTVQFRRLVRETPPGRSVPVEVVRNGHDEKLTVQVGNNARSMDTRLREALPPRNFNFKFSMPELFPGMTPVLGIQAEDVSGQLGTYFHVPGEAGVLIREVSPNSAAAKAGLKAGDVITSVDGAAVKTVDDLREHLRDQRERKSVSLTIIRQGSEIKVPVTIEAPTEHPIRTRAAAL